MPEIVIAKAHEPPFDVGLVVLEEDRWLVLSASNVALPERGETETLVTGMTDATLPTRGEMLIRGNRALAIVHDLERTPTFCIEDLALIFGNIAAYCDDHQISAIAMQPLGAVHGTLAFDESVEMIRRSPLGTVRRLWIIAP